MLFRMKERSIPPWRNKRSINMKQQLKRALAVALFIGFASALMADKAGDHQHKTAGPKGGRILEKTKPLAEFLVEKDRTVTISFYDEKLKPVPAAEQQVTVTAGKEKLAFEKKGDVLASTSKLPEGDSYNVVIQLRDKPNARPQNHRFKMDLSTCGGCKLAEYACTCHE